MRLRPRRAARVGDRARGRVQRAEPRALARLARLNLVDAPPERLGRALPERRVERLLEAVGKLVREVPGAAQLEVARAPERAAALALRGVGVARVVGAGERTS